MSKSTNNATIPSSIPPFSRYSPVPGAVVEVTIDKEDGSISQSSDFSQLSSFVPPATLRLVLAVPQRIPPDWVVSSTNIELVVNAAVARVNSSSKKRQEVLADIRTIVQSLTIVTQMRLVTTPPEWTSPELFVLVDIAWRWMSQNDGIDPTSSTFCTAVDRTRAAHSWANFPDTRAFSDKISVEAEPSGRSKRNRKQPITKSSLVAKKPGTTKGSDDQTLVPMATNRRGTTKRKAITTHPAHILGDPARLAIRGLFPYHRRTLKFEPWAERVIKKPWPSKPRKLPSLAEIGFPSPFNMFGDMKTWLMFDYNQIIFWRYTLSEHDPSFLLRFETIVVATQDSPIGIAQLALAVKQKEGESYTSAVTTFVAMVLINLIHAYGVATWEPDHISTIDHVTGIRSLRAWHDILSRLIEDIRDIEPDLDGYEWVVPKERPNAHLGIVLGGNRWIEGTTIRSQDERNDGTTQGTSNPNPDIKICQNSNPNPETLTDLPSLGPNAPTTSNLSSVGTSARASLPHNRSTPHIDQTKPQSSPPENRKKKSGDDHEDGDDKNDNNNDDDTQSEYTEQSLPQNDSESDNNKPEDPKPARKKGKGKVASKHIREVVASESISDIDVTELRRRRGKLPSEEVNWTIEKASQLGREITERSILKGYDRECYNFGYGNPEVYGITRAGGPKDWNNYSTIDLWNNADRWKDVEPAEAKVCRGNEYAKIREEKTAAGQLEEWSQDLEREACHIRRQKELLTTDAETLMAKNVSIARDSFYAAGVAAKQNGIDFILYGFSRNPTYSLSRVQSFVLTSTSRLGGVLSSEGPTAIAPYLQQVTAAHDQEVLGYIKEGKSIPHEDLNLIDVPLNIDTSYQLIPGLRNINLSDPKAVKHAKKALSVKIPPLLGNPKKPLVEINTSNSDALRDMCKHIDSTFKSTFFLATSKNTPVAADNQSPAIIIPPILPLCTQSMVPQISLPQEWLDGFFSPPPGPPSFAKGELLEVYPIVTLVMLAQLWGTDMDEGKVTMLAWACYVVGGFNQPPLRGLGTAVIQAQLAVALQNWSLLGLGSWFNSILCLAGSHRHRYINVPLPYGLDATSRPIGTEPVNQIRKNHLQAILHPDPSKRCYFVPFKLPHWTMDASNEFLENAQVLLGSQGQTHTYADIRRNVWESISSKEDLDLTFVSAPTLHEDAYNRITLDYSHPYSMLSLSLRRDRKDGKNDAKGKNKVTNSDENIDQITVPYIRTITLQPAFYAASIIEVASPSELDQAASVRETQGKSRKGGMEAYKRAKKLFEEKRSSDDEMTGSDNEASSTGLNAFQREKGSRKRPLDTEEQGPSTSKRLKT